jgi:hypothetical protein
MSLGPRSPQIINPHLQILNPRLPIFRNPSAIEKGSPTANICVPGNTPIFLCNAGIHLLAACIQYARFGLRKRKIEPIRLSLADESFNVDQMFGIATREMGFNLGYTIIGNRRPMFDRHRGKDLDI